MRYGLILVLLLALTACNSPTESPTAAVTEAVADTVPPTTEASEPQPDAEATAEVTADPLEQAGVVLPPAGTLIAPATEDPNPDSAQPFDFIIFEQSGGPNNETFIIQVFNDGRVERDGVTTTISAQQVAMLDALLKELNFFGLQGQFAVPGASTDVYSYRITVEQGGGSRTINAQDGYTPTELLELFSLLAELGA